MDSELGARMPRENAGLLQVKCHMCECRYLRRWVAAAPKDANSDPNLYHLDWYVMFISSAFN